MGEISSIEWCDATFNYVWGCAKVSDACTHCYAEAWAKRTGFGNLWGPEAERRTFGEKHWNEPMRWNEKAKNAGKRLRVFCSSMADVFDNHPTCEAERPKLWELIEQTPHLDWLLLTKRIGNAKSMLPWTWQDPVTPQHNVWIGATVVTQEEYDRDIFKLLEVPASVHFISSEPLLGSLRVINSFSAYSKLDWMIVGGESGHNARPMNPAWVRAIRDECVDAGVAFFFKQWGNWLPASEPDARQYSIEDDSQEHTWDGSDDGFSIHVRKKGHRTLDGRIWHQFPR